MSTQPDLVPPPVRPLPVMPTWPLRAAVLRALSPVERFLKIEAASGILLLIAAAVALVWANSPWRDSYQALWHTPFGVRIGPFAFERDLHFWINDGLMTVFFFVVGLEIRREMHNGELSQLRRAALPLAAAVGGMVVPALLYVVLNRTGGAPQGWGVPMATDIAFAVGVLTLLGRRVPPVMRILLLALAVIDDLGAILVIALFYTSGFDPLGLLVGAGGFAGVWFLRAMGIGAPWAYVAPGVVLWAGTYACGVHPTIAGVIMGLLTPVIPWFGATPAPHEAVSPAERLEHALHGWVAYVTMPLFALANAGVTIGGMDLSGETRAVFLGVLVGLAVGKPLGVVAASWLAVRLRLALLPAGVGARELAVIGFVAGIGFTMSIFIAGLAFPSGALLDTAKLGVLCASGAAAVIGLTFGRLVLRQRGSAKAT